MTRRGFGRALSAGSALLAACLDGEAAPIVRVAEAAPPVVLNYYNLEPAAEAPAINFIVKLRNLGGRPLSLAAFEIRYYFSNELGDRYETEVFYTDTCCSEPRRDFGTAVALALRPSASGASADSYLSITFDPEAGQLAVGDNAQIEVSFHAPGYDRDVTQRNDFSFSSEASGTQAQWDRCPDQCARFSAANLSVFRAGVLVWGQPP